MFKRKSLVALLVLIFVTLGAGCHRITHQIKGSGVRKTEKRVVAPFKAISVEGAYNIEVVAQKDQSLEVEADDNILPSIRTEVSAGVLKINTRGSFSLSNEVNIKITVPNLEKVSASGAGMINVTGVKNDRFDIDVNGAPALRVAGETKEVNLETNGAGMIDARKLRASRVTVNSNGVSNVEVHASDQLNVTISGPSHVLYAGDPEVNQTINGPGSLEKKESSGS